jgi:ubiquinone/menaquinone biosynthesis C-methylase UbiE
MKKADYGVDAPKIIRNLLVIGLLLLLISIFFPADLHLPFQVLLRIIFIAFGGFFVITGSLMFAYARFGKFRHRDRILNMHDWKGDEQVLDVGTGLGLLMIGAAKKLTTGKSYGIDIYNSKDLSGNTIEHTRENAALENVSAKVEILSENILKTTFGENSFDVVVSNLCLHNIEKAEEREQACREIRRILKPSGKVILSDFKNIAEYKRVFESLGMNAEKGGTYYFDTFPPLSIIVATYKTTW